MSEREVFLCIWDSDEVITAYAVPVRLFEKLLVVFESWHDWEDSPRFICYTLPPVNGKYIATSDQPFAVIPNGYEELKFVQFVFTDTRQDTVNAFSVPKHDIPNLVKSMRGFISIPDVSPCLNFEKSTQRWFTNARQLA